MTAKIHKSNLLRVTQVSGQAGIQPGRAGSLIQPLDRYCATAKTTLGGDSTRIAPDPTVTAGPWLALSLCRSWARNACPYEHQQGGLLPQAAVDPKGKGTELSVWVPLTEQPYASAAQSCLCWLDCSYHQLPGMAWLSLCRE